MGQSLDQYISGLSYIEDSLDRYQTNLSHASTGLDVLSEIQKTLSKASKDAKALDERIDQLRLLADVFKAFPPTPSRSRTRLRAIPPRSRSLAGRSQRGRQPQRRNRRERGSARDEQHPVPSKRDQCRRGRQHGQCRHGE